MSETATAKSNSITAIPDELDWVFRIGKWIVEHPDQTKQWFEENTSVIETDFGTVTIFRHIGFKP